VTNLVGQLSRELSGPALGRIAALVVEPERRLEAAVAGLAPALVAALTDKAANPQDLADVVDLMTSSGFDGTSGRALSSRLGDDGFSDLVARGGALTTGIFDEREDSVAAWISARSGVAPAAASSLMAVAAPVLLDMIAGIARHTGGFNVSTVGDVLRRQAPFLRNRMPAGLAGVLGISDLSRLGSAPQDLAFRPESHPRSRLLAWLTWILIFGTAILAWWWFAGRERPGTIDPRVSIVNGEGPVDCSAQVRNESTQEALGRAVREAFGQQARCDIVVNPQVRPLAWVANVDRVVAALKRQGAELQFDGRAVRLGGWLSDAERIAILGDLQAALPPGVAYGDKIDRAAEYSAAAKRKALAALAPLDRQFTAEAFAAAMNQAVIAFAPGSADLPPDAHELIARAAAVLMTAPPGLTIEIGGHTDNRGDPASNLQLSEARAGAIRLALMEGGVSGTALVARGYGQALPIASNDTEYGRFRNRRITYAIAPK
jgi:outer membrane protein OmpA-like peptidoglycan-associated protein